MKLLDICETIVDCPHSTAKDEGTGYPLIRTPNVGKGRLKLAGVHRVSENVYNQRNERAVPQVDDLILAREAPVGNVAIIRKGQQVCLGQRTVLIRPNKKYVDPDYLVYYLLSPVLQHKLLSSANGATVSHLNMSSIRSLEVQVPEIEVQKRIGAILARIDDKIELNSTINENLHQLIAAYYAEIFKECEHTAKISDYADRVFSGGTPTTSNETYWSGEFKWLSSGETSQKYIVDTEKTITQAGVDNSSTRLAKKYDTVIASAGQGHTRGQTSMLLTDTYINQSIIVVESERIYMPFIYWNICGRYEELRVISNSNSIRGSLTTKMISAFTSPKADITQISRFSELAWAAIHEIEKNCNEIARLAALRDTLLPKLMNGEIDVSTAQI